MAVHRGTTQDAASPILGAKFWKKGTKIEGTVLRSFDTENGACFEIELRKPVTVDGKQEKKVSIGAMKGFTMALNASGLESLESRDRVIIECTGSTATDKGNPRVDFAVTVDRD